MATKKQSEDLNLIVQRLASRIDDCTSLFLSMSTLAEKLYRDQYEIDEMEMSALLHALKSMADSGLEITVDL